MSHRKVIIFLMFLSIVGVLAGILLTEQEYFGICRDGYTYSYGEVGNLNNPPRIGCADPLSEELGQPLALNSISLLIVSIILLFFSQEIFNTWKKFAVWFIPIAFFLIAITPTSCGQLMCFDRELITWFTSVGFLVISLLIILYKKIKPSRQGPTLL